VVAVTVDTAGLVGWAVPRVATPLPVGENRTDEVDDVAAKYLGFRLDPWQRTLVDYLTTPDESGRRPDLVGALVARQQGKTTVMQAYCLWAILNGERVLSSAQGLALAQSIWRDVAQLFDPKDDNAPLSHMTTRLDKSASGAQLTLTNGGGWWVRAANDKAARGLSGMSIAWFDEARHLRTWEPWAAITPTLSTATEPQTVVTSNAGDLRSVVLNTLAKRGRQRATGFTTGDTITWLEWSADPGKDLDDREGWCQANPQLGSRMDWRTLESDYRTYQAADDMDGWRTERLCQTIGAIGAALDVNQFRRLTDLTDPPTPGDRSLVMSVAIDLNRRGAVILIGRQLDDGRPQMGVLTHWEAQPGAEVSDRDVADEVVRLFEQWRPIRILYNSFVAAGVAHLLTRRRLPMFDMKGRRYFDSCQVFAELIRTGRLAHDGDPALVGHVAIAVRENLRNGDGWMLSRRASPGPIYAADAAAMLAHQTSKRRTSRSGVITLAS
jgi:phage terminase large subunit-like protein